MPQSARYVLDPCPSSRCLKLNGAPGTPKYEKTCCGVCAGIGVVPAPGSPNPKWEKAPRYLRRSFTPQEKRGISWDEESTTMGATLKVWVARREKALLRLRRGTNEPLTRIKARIWKRDGGRCAICDLDLDKYPKFATLGHRVDKVCGGSDADINLDLQCKQCNQQIKPLHETLEAYFSWLADYRGETDDAVPAKEKRAGWLARLLRAVRRDAA